MVDDDLVLGFRPRVIFNARAGRLMGVNDFAWTGEGSLSSSLFPGLIGGESAFSAVVCVVGRGRGGLLAAIVDLSLRRVGFGRDDSPLGLLAWPSSGALFFIDV